MFDNIDITGSFDGGNPQDPDAIIQTGANAFTVIPFSEDNDSNYKFRLDLKVINHSSDRIKLHLNIDWQEPRFNHLRNYVYTKHTEDADWSYHRMHVNQTQAMGSIECRAGETYVCLHPKYNYGDYRRFVVGIPESDRIEKEKIGLTSEGRELWGVKINSDGNGKRPIMMVARVHPYETSGSYCIEGIVDHFSKNLSPFPFHISPIYNLSPIYLIPMANPDGVYNGLCKLTRPGGTDLSKTCDFTDSCARLLKSAIDKIQPWIYCEFHNWMWPDRDGIYYLNRLQARRFIRHMPPQDEFKKTWKVFLKKKWFAHPPHGFKRYCREEYNSLCLCVEYPWYLRGIEDMKKLGTHTLDSLSRFH